MIAFHLPTAGRAPLNAARRPASFPHAVSARCVKLALALVATVAAATVGAAETVEAPRRLLTLSTGRGNARNGEGDFVRLRDGSILFVYGAWLSDKMDDDARAHIVARRSSDHGRTWSPAREIFAREGRQNDMSVSLLRLADGRLALFNGRKNSRTDCTPMVRFSTDEAKTWSTPVCCVPEAERDYYVLNNARVIQLKSGRILVPLAKHSQKDANSSAGRLSCVFSDDGGRTWRKGREYPVFKTDGKRVTAQEPGVVELKDGRVYMNFRTGEGRQWQAFSKDGGETWTDFGPSSLFGPLAPATIRRVPDGRLLAVWNDHEGHPEYAGRGVWGRVPLTLAFSSDEGRTWRDKRVIEPDLDRFYCYIATFFDGDDLLLHYYCNKPALTDSCVTLVPNALARPRTAGLVSLNGTWRLTAFPQPDDGAVRTLPLPADLAVKRYEATVPGCCEMELVRAGELADPLVGFNAFAFRAYEGHQWLYEKTFRAPARAPGERCVLTFDGIDTLADVFLNGEKIGEADNMLVPHAFDVTGKVREGAENTVAVLIRPVGLASRDVQLGELGLTMIGGGDHEHFRKAAHMYGWDILPHLPVSGLWRDVRFEVRPAVRIENPAWILMRADVKRRTADVRVLFRVHAPFSRWYRAKTRVTLARYGKVAWTEDRELRGSQVSFAVGGLREIDFWWPRGAGEPALYDAKIEVIGEGGEVLAEDVRKIGLRTVALEYADRKLPENPGKMLFRINGEPIYIRGVDWVPLDPIPSNQRAQLKDVLPMMADLNVNLVRVWGGGVYEPDEFFDWCDRNGVMVWQDFMNACAVPPMDDAFAEAMKREVTSVVLRYRNHASIALWAGDNENDIARTWSNGRTLARDPTKNRINREVIPNVLHELDVTRPYLPSSPLVTREAHLGLVEPAEDHMWDGPRGWWKTDYYAKAACWFCSEGGAHAIPARSSLERMMGRAAAERPWSNPDVKDWKDLKWTDEWVYRATNPYLDRWNHLIHRNDIAIRQCAALFGDVPRHDLDLFIAQSQSAQAEAVKFQVENFRSQKFVSKGGFVVWNLRDGWPTVSDAFTDYYGAKKKAYEAVKTAYRNLLVMVAEDGRVLALNATLKPVKGRVKIVEAKDGSTVFEGPLEVAANGRAEVTRLAWKGQGLYRIAWTSDAGDGRNHYLHGEPPFAWSDYSNWTK